MEEADRIKRAIRDIAQRRENVTLDEIEWVVNHLKQYYQVGRRTARHGILFRVRDQRFMVNTHNPGSKQVKPYSVDAFIDAMIELGWYED